MPNKEKDDFLLTTEDLEHIEKSVRPYAWSLGRLIGYIKTGKDVGEYKEKES